jgi:hypothetical protein
MRGDWVTLHHSSQLKFEGRWMAEFKMSERGDSRRDVRGGGRGMNSRQLLNGTTKNAKKRRIKMNGN